MLILMYVYLAAVVATAFSLGYLTPHKAKVRIKHDR